MTPDELKVLPFSDPRMAYPHWMKVNINTDLGWYTVFAGQVYVIHRRFEHTTLSMFAPDPGTTSISSQEKWPRLWWHDASAYHVNTILYRLPIILAEHMVL